MLFGGWSPCVNLNRDVEKLGKTFRAIVSFQPSPILNHLGCRGALLLTHPNPNNRFFPRLAAAPPPALLSPCLLIATPPTPQVPPQRAWQKAELNKRELRWQSLMQ